MIKLACAAMLCVPLLGFAANWQGYTVSTMPFSAIESQPLSVCYLDLYQKLKQHMQQQLREMNPNNKKALADLFAAQSPKLNQAYLCLVKAKSLGLKRLPALVNTQTGQVIYGRLSLNNLPALNQKVAS